MLHTHALLLYGFDISSLTTTLITPIISINQEKNQVERINNVNSEEIAF
jgi:hypothetical protein